MLGCSESKVLPKATACLWFYGQQRQLLAFLGFCFGALRVLVLIRGYLRVSDGYSGLGIIWDHDAVWVFIVGGGVYIYFGV